MGERTAVRFLSGPASGEAEACIYIHWGGPPSEMAVVFHDFFERIEKDCDSVNYRYNNASYLAARFVAFMAMYAYDKDDGEDVLSLAINGLGVVKDDPRYYAASGFWMYTVQCTSRTVKPQTRPSVVYHDVLAVPDESDKTKRSVVWERFIPLDEAANNYARETEEPNE